MTINTTPTEAEEASADEQRKRWNRQNPEDQINTRTYIERLIQNRVLDWITAEDERNLTKVELGDAFKSATPEVKATVKTALGL